MKTATAKTMPKLSDPPFSDTVLHVRQLMLEDCAEDLTKAKEAIRLCNRLLQTIKDGDAEETSWLAFQLGMEVASLELGNIWNRDLGRSRKVTDGARAGGRRRRKADPTELQAAVDALRAEQPDWKFTRVTNLVGKRCGFSGKTVRNNTKK